MWVGKRKVGMCKMKVIYLSYARASSRKQKIEGYTCASQIEEHKRWTERHGVEIDEYFIDDGYSSSNIKRPAYRRLVSRISENKKRKDGTYLIKYVLLIRYQSRLVRDLMLKRSMTNMFNLYNVEIICMNGSIWDGGDNIDISMASDMTTLFDEVERRRVPGRVRNSYMEAVLNGNYPIGGYSPRGYKRVENKRLGKGSKLIAEEGAKEVAVKLYEMVASNKYTLRKMKLFMNQHNIFNCKWDDRQVYVFFTNPIYYGRMRTRFFDSEDIKSKISEANLSGWYDPINKIHTEPLVSKELWTEVQYAIGTRKRTTTYNYLFKNRVRCDCGHWMVSKSTVKKKDVYKYYYCNNCKNRVNETKILKLFLTDYEEMFNQNKDETIKMINEKILRKENRMNMLAKLYDDCEIDDKVYIQELKTINKDIKELSTSKEKLEKEMMKSFRSMEVVTKREIVRNAVNVVNVSLKDNFGKQNIIIKYKDNS